MIVTPTQLNLFSNMCTLHMSLLSLEFQKKKKYQFNQEIKVTLKQVSINFSCYYNFGRNVNYKSCIGFSSKSYVPQPLQITRTTSCSFPEHGPHSSASLTMAVVFTNYKSENLENWWAYTFINTTIKKPSQRTEFQMKLWTMAVIS